MSSSQKQHYRWGLDQNLAKFKRIYGRASGLCRKTKTDDLKISVKPELATKISRQEFSDVRQKMQGLNHKSVTINGQVRKGGLHSILFDNAGNKADKQILGVILDACNHLIRKHSRDRRYITFSSGLNEPGSFNQNENCETCISDGGHSRFSGFRFKKINISFAALLVFAMCFFVSCGDSAKQVTGNGDSVSNFGKLGGECYPNETCDEGLLCDEESNICVEDPENPVNDSDTSSEQNDDKADSGSYSDSDNGDSLPDSNDTPSYDSDPVPDSEEPEQPDEDHNENPNDQDIPIEQPDENHEDLGKCDPGYFWADYNIDPWLVDPEDGGINDGKDYNNQCAPCVSVNWVITNTNNRYCPGGNISDLKGKSINFQMARCPQYTYVNADYSDCVCTYGVPPPGKTCADLVNGTTGGDEPQCGETTNNYKGKCDPGYVWVDNCLDSWVIDDGISVNNQCVACVSLPSLVKYIQHASKYCPGGDDLTGKTVVDQTRACNDDFSLWTTPNDTFSDCLCMYDGLPASGRECRRPYVTKHLTISPKINN